MNQFDKGGHYSEIYRRAFNFHRKHHGAKTPEEWRAAAEDMALFGVAPFEVMLITEIYAEIERAGRCDEMREL